MPYGVAPRVTSDASNMATSGGSQEKQDELAISDANSLHVSFAEPSCHDVAMEGNLGDSVGHASSGDNQDSRGGETTLYREADDRHERSQDATNKDGSSPPTQETTRFSRGRPSPERQVPDNPKRYPSIAVVVPAPPWKRRRLTRSTTGANTRKQRLHESQGDNSNSYEDRSSSIRPSERSQQSQKRKYRRAAGSIPYHFEDSPSADCLPENQNVLGRAILTVQSDGARPAYFFTFMPEAAPVASPERSPCHQMENSRSLSLGCTAVSRKTEPYSSEENALLVRLKEREKLSWIEIGEHFPNRSTTSLQVHYSTKLRHKTTVRSRRQHRY